MQLATVLTPMSDENLQLAAQCGVTDVVARYPGPDIGELLALKRRTTMDMPEITRTWFVSAHPRTIHQREMR